MLILKSVYYAREYEWNLCKESYVKNIYSRQPAFVTQSFQKLSNFVWQDETTKATHARKLMKKYTLNYRFTFAELFFSSLMFVSFVNTKKFNTKIAW